MKILGIDIGGTKCAVTFGKEANNSLTILDKRIFSTDISKPSLHMINSFFEICDEFIEKYGTVDSIGISCGGPLDSNSGVIINPPHLPLLHGVPIVKIFKERYNIPVFIQNDANACALAEWIYGAGRNCKNIVFLTFGTGLGAGLILDGKLYEGTNGNAGEVGHIRLNETGPIGFGKSGSFEGFCSGNGIAQLGYILGKAAHERGETPSYYNPDTAPEGITAKSVALAATQEGDATAKEVYRISGENLGKGLAVIIDILNPQRIIIGSVFARAKNLLLESCEKVLKEEALGISLGCCELVSAELLDNIGDYAAITVGIYGMRKEH